LYCIFFTRCKFDGDYLTQFSIFFNFFNAAVESDAANEMMDLIRSDLLGADFSSLAEDPSGIALVGAEEFS
jgi:hypothetical protein